MKSKDAKKNKKRVKKVDLIQSYGSMPMRDLDEWISGLSDEEKERLKKYIKEKNINIEHDSDQFTFY